MYSSARGLEHQFNNSINRELINFVDEEDEDDSSVVLTHEHELKRDIQPLDYKQSQDKLVNMKQEFTRMGT